MTVNVVLCHSSANPQLGHSTSLLGVLAALSHSLANPQLGYSNQLTGWLGRWRREVGDELLRGLEIFVANWPRLCSTSPPLWLSGRILRSSTFHSIPQNPNSPLLVQFSLPSNLPPRTLSVLESLQSITQPSKDAYIHPSVVSSISLGNDFGSQADADINSLFNNNLQILWCPDGDFLLIFPTGENFDKIGFIGVSRKEPTWKVNLNTDGNIFTMPNGSNHRILRMSVTASVTELSGWDLLSSSAARGSTVVGLLFSCTMYTIHWFSVEVKNSGSERGSPVLVHLGMKEFHSSIMHACWSLHLATESIVLLENGGLFLFDLSSCLGSSSFANELKATRISISWDDFGVDLDTEWLSCGFAWHPRILIVANSKSVFLVDVRYRESNVSVLAEIDTLDLNNSRGPDQYIAFSMSGSGGFHFTVASKCLLFLFDIRKPLMPVLQWVHGLDNPRYVNVFSLSDLRQNLVDDKYAWATESGFAILLGSFWSCEFSLFCYGPSVHALDGSMTPKISTFWNSLYAWELPSELSLSGHQCHCGDSLLKEDFWKTSLPSWIDWQQKKEIVLGFCILVKNLPVPLPEIECSNGFTLIRLMSSGKLEMQTYNSSFDSPSAKLEAGEGMLSQSENCLLYHSSDQKYKFPRKFKYLKLDYLCAYLSCNLVDLLTRKIRNSVIDPTEAIPDDQDCNKLPHDKLKAAGVDLKGSLLMTDQVFSSISLPTSIHEIGLRRLWTGLPVDLLQLAVPNQADLLEVLTQMKVSSTHLDVPNLSQLPPFLFRKPLNHNNKSSHKVQHGDAILGPSLPLPVLLTLNVIDKEMNYSGFEEEASVYSAKTEISHQCNEIIKVAKNVVSRGLHPVVNDSYVVSLSSDRDEAWVCSQKLSQPKCFSSYRPQAFSDKNGATMHNTQDELVLENEKYDTFICKMHEEFTPELNRDTKLQDFPNSSNKQNGREMFDELCPVELIFDGSPINFGVNEVKRYKLLKRQFSKWQEGFKPYQDFCSQSKLRKHVP